MYKAKDKSEYSFFDFNQPLGMHMNPENRWIRLAELIPWDEYEEKYASRFMSDTGNVAKPCRMALGALIIQKRLGFSDRELVEEITENPYLQYFIGLPGYQETRSGLHRQIYIRRICTSAKRRKASRYDQKAL